MQRAWDIAILGERPSCAVCGEPIDRDNKTGICRREPRCERAYWAARRELLRARAGRG